MRCLHASHLVTDNWDSCTAKGSQSSSVFIFLYIWWLIFLHDAYTFSKYLPSLVYSTPGIFHQQEHTVVLGSFFLSSFLILFILLKMDCLDTPLLCLQLLSQHALGGRHWVHQRESTHIQFALSLHEFEMCDKANIIQERWGKENLEASCSHIRTETIRQFTVDW